MFRGEITQTNKWAEYMLAFFLPALLILSIFVVFGVFPFGEKSLLVVDMNSEYIDYFAFLNNNIRTGGSLLHSWDVSMGLDLLGLIAFYTASPFNILLLIMPVAMITEGVLIITVLKIGTCGLFFFIYARKTFQLPWLWIVAFSTAYALIGYNMYYLSNIMWLDGVAFLPLALLGIEGILKDGRFRLFTISMVYIFFSSYYIGYMIGIFSLLYITASYFAWEDSIIIYLKKLGLMVISTLISAGCCAFLLLPAFLNLKNGQNSMWNIPVSFELKYGITELFSKLLPGVYDSLTDAGLPNIYFSVFGAITAVIYFFNKGIQKREKFIYGIFIAFLLICMSCEILNLGWHAFEDPTWFPARYSFIFSFLGLYLGLRCVEMKKDANAGTIVAATTIIIVIFIEIAIKRYSYIDLFNVCMGLFFLVAYSILMWHLFKGKRRGISIALIALLCAELWFNSYGIITGIDDQFEYKTRQSYVDYRETYAPVFTLLPAQNAGAYRTELGEQRNANGAMALNYHSISHYSSTTNQKVNTLLRMLAYNTGTINEIRFAPGSPLAAGLLGIKYVLSKDDMGNAYQIYNSLGDVGIYENKLAFPLGFFGDLTMNGVDTSGTNPFALQNMWSTNMWRGEEGEPFLPVDDVIMNTRNLTYENKDTGQQYFTKILGESDAYIDWEINNSANDECYAYFSLYKGRFSRVKVYVNGERSNRILAYRNNAIIPLGTGDVITLSLELEGVNISYEDVYFYRLDMDAAQHLAERAQENQMQFTEFEDTSIKGTLTAPTNGYLLTTMPYDEGWTIYVNGTKTDLVQFVDVFVAVPVTQGVNDITMRYFPSGFQTGAIISTLSIIVAAFLFIRIRKT